jgi:lysophospholipase L1-like esterase
MPFQRINGRRFGLKRQAEGGSSANLRYQAVITPVLTPITTLDPGFEAWTTATNLTSYVEIVTGASTVNQEQTVIHGGSNAVRLDVDGSNNNVGFYQTVAASPANSWIRLEFYGRASVAGKTIGVQNGSFAPGNSVAQLTTEWRKNKFGIWNATAGESFTIKRGSSASCSLYVDDLALFSISLASCLAIPRHVAGNILVKQNLRVANGNQIGFAAHLDSIADPANGIFVYVDGANIRLDKLVNHARTNLFSAASTWTDDDELKIVQEGNDYYVMRNGATVGTKQTVTDAGIVDNTLCAQFSNCEDNSFTSPFIAVSGTLQRVTVLGDSIAAAAGSWTYLAPRTYNQGFNIVTNRAVGGSSILTDGDADADFAAQVTAAASDTPDIIFVSLGTNDTDTTDTLRAEYEAQLNNLIAAHASTRIISVGIFDRTVMAGVAEKNALIATACTNAAVEHHNPSGIITADMLTDGTHFNAAGNQAASNWVLSWL